MALKNILRPSILFQNLSKQPIFTFYYSLSEGHLPAVTSLDNALPLEKLDITAI